MSGPVVTVVILTKNRPHLVDAAVRSALAQTETDLEVVVVDDGSSPPVAARWDDPRVRLVRNERSVGMSASRNVGLREARGEYVTYLDDDDELLPDMVRVSLETIAGSTLPAPVAALTAMRVVNPDGSTHHVRLPVTLPRGSRWNLQRVESGSFKADNTLFVRTELLREIGGWDERLMVYEKPDLFLRLNAVCSIQGRDEVTYRMLDHPGPRVHRKAAAQGDSLVLTDRKHAAIFREYPRERARRLSAAAIYYLKGDRWGAAIRTSARAVWYDPRSGRVWFRFAASLGGPRALLLYRRARDRARGLRGVPPT